MSDQFSYRTWGYWRVIEERPGYKIKELTVLPDRSLSKQYHNHRDEYWIVLEGIGDLVLESPDSVYTISNDHRSLVPGVQLKIPRRVIHKLSNVGFDNLTILETQVGLECKEDDIVRLD